MFSQTKWNYAALFSFSVLCFTFNINTKASVYDASDPVNQPKNQELNPYKTRLNSPRQTFYHKCGSRASANTVARTVPPYYKRPLSYSSASAGPAAPGSSTNDVNSFLAQIISFSEILLDKKHYNYSLLSPAGLFSAFSFLVNIAQPNSSSSIEIENLLKLKKHRASHSGMQGLNQYLKKGGFSFNTAVYKPQETGQNSLLANKLKDMGDIKLVTDKQSLNAFVQSYYKQFVVSFPDHIYSCDVSVLNAVSYKVQGLYQFSRLSHSDLFYPGPNETPVSTNFINMHANFKLYDSSSFVTVSIPLRHPFQKQGSKFQAYVIFAKEGHLLPVLSYSMVQKLHTQLNSVPEKEFQFFMPAFSLESILRLSQPQLPQTLRMNNPDFSPFFGPEPIKRLEIMQISKVCMDEHGSQPTGYHSFNINQSKKRANSIPILNGPFHFLIVDEAKGVPLLVGQVNKVLSDKENCQVDGF